MTLNKQGFLRFFFGFFGPLWHKNNVTKLVNTEGQKIPLQQLGHQIFLAACPRELELTPCLIGNLHNNSLMPVDKFVRPEASFEIGKHKETPKEGGAESGFTLETFEHHRQQQNKPAIGQQTALPKPTRKQKKKKLGQQWAANKLSHWRRLGSSTRSSLSCLAQNTWITTQHKV